MSDKIVTLKDENSNNLYPTSSYNAIKDPNGYTLPSDFTKFDLIDSTGTNWIRYTNGIQICWGFYDDGSNINDKSGIVVNFPVSFNSGTTPTFLETSGKLDGNAANRTTQANYYALSNTSVSFGWYGGTARSAGWLAIGYWK